MGKLAVEPVLIKSEFLEESFATAGFSWKFGLVGWSLNVLINYKVISWTGPKTERLTIVRAATHETELEDHDFCLSRSEQTVIL